MNGFGLFLGSDVMHAQLPKLLRRQILTAPAASLLVAAAPLQKGSYALADVLTLSAAVALAKEGEIIHVAAGTYRERLLISHPVTLQAWPPGADVTIVWETDRPYESVVQSSGVGVHLIGLKLRHSSPSVANNYAVFMQGGSLLLEDCDISSATGSGVGSEGGQLSLIRCNVHQCKRHGVAMFGDLEGSEGEVLLQECSISGNELNGLLVADNAHMILKGGRISRNGWHGVYVKDGIADFEGNIFERNGQGAWSAGESAVIDLLAVARTNTCI
ncbi:g8458 [Coccomyxa elongata]